MRAIILGITRGVSTAVAREAAITKWSHQTKFPCQKLLGSTLLSLVLCVAISGIGCSAVDRVAATVDGEEIPESIITDYIESYIAFRGYTTDQWIQALELQDMTEEEFREDVIDFYVRYLLFEHAAEAEGITVTAEELDEEISSIREENSLEDDDAWQNYLSSLGYTEESYRSTIEYSILVNKLYEANVEEPEVSDDQILVYLQSFDSYYYGKHFVRIWFDSDQAVVAQNTLKEILASDNPTTAFYALLEQSGEESGDYGWTCIESFNEDFLLIADEAEVGEVYPYTVQSSDGWMIILCDESYYGSEDESIQLGTIPSSLLEEIYSDINEELYSERCNEYVQSLYDAAEIIINDMPAGLSYGS